MSITYICHLIVIMGLMLTIVNSRYLQSTNMDVLLNLTGLVFYHCLIQGMLGQIQQKTFNRNLFGMLQSFHWIDANNQNRTSIGWKAFLKEAIPVLAHWKIMVLLLKVLILSLQIYAYFLIHIYQCFLNVFN